VRHDGFETVMFTPEAVDGDDCGLGVRRAVDPVRGVRPARLDLVPFDRDRF